MTQRRHVLSITVGVRSPFVIAGVEASAVGIDTPALRDETERPVLPGDQLKGLLRDAADTLNTAAPAALDGSNIRDLFGRVYNRGTDEEEAQQQPDPFLSFAPNRGSLIFADLVAETMRKRPLGAADTTITDWPSEPIKAWAESARRSSDQPANHFTRIKIDGTTGTVEHGMLQVVELAAPLAAVAEFKGEAVLYASDATAARVQKLLDRALRIVPYFGGLRSAGFGEHVAQASSVVLTASRDLIPAAPPWGDGERFTLVGTFDRPYLVAAQRESDNIFVGSAVVPGGVIKGALAMMLERAGYGRDGEIGGAHGRVLAAMRISHAFPLDAAQELELDRALPLSAMHDPDSKQYACAFAQRAEADDERAIPCGILNDRCADFQPDWKGAAQSDFARAVKRPAAEEVPYLPRGHTTIDAERGVAQDQDLYVEVSRGARAGGDPRRFRFAVDFGACAASPEERPAVINIQRLLRAGLDGVGKTRAHFSLASAPSPQDARRRIPGRPALGGRVSWRIMLETAGILLDPEDPHDPEDPQSRPEKSAHRVTDTLKAYFRDVVPDAALCDDGHYVQRVLVGAYQARRRRPDGNTLPYRPYSLFTAGSCFLLEAAQADAEKVAHCLAELERNGLPVRRWGRNGLAPVTSWRECPYLPENGYGAISVEDPVFDAIEGAASRIAETAKKNQDGARRS